MLCDSNPYTLEETLASLDFLIKEYYDNHNMWFSLCYEDTSNPLHKDPMNSKRIIEDREIDLYQHVYRVYPYVYEKSFDLNNTEFQYSANFAYPYFDEPEDLMVSTMQLYSFWTTFLGNAFTGAPYRSPKAQPINQLAIDAYLRFRIDFAWNGPFGLKENPLKESRRHAAFFTQGEIGHITKILTSTLRRKINITPLEETAISVFSDQGEVFARTYNPEGQKKISPTGMEIPDFLSHFFEGKVGGGIRVLFEHSEVVSLISTIGDYQPTQFIAPPDEPFPDYSNSALIHAAVSQWMKKFTKTARVEKLMSFIGAPMKDLDGSYSLWTEMASGTARLSLCTLAAINKYMTEVAGGPVDDNHWQPLLDACASVQK